MHSQSVLSLEQKKRDIYCNRYREMKLFAVSHIQRTVLVANLKKLLFYTVANPARGVLNKEKRTKDKKSRP